MDIKFSSYSNQSSLISSIFFLIVGVILSTCSDSVLKLVSIGIGIILAINSVVAIAYYFIRRKTFKEMTSKFSLFYGLITLALSAVFIAFSDVVEQFIRFVIGGWILFSGITRLIDVLSLRKNNVKFIPLLIVAIALICIGLYTIFVGDIILSTVGFIMIAYGIIEIIGYIFYRKKETKAYNKDDDQLIIKSDDKPLTKKEIKIKDVEAEEIKIEKKSKKSKK